MIKTVTQIGSDHALILDPILLQFSGLEEGHRVNVEVHSGGTITITPMESVHPKTEHSDLIRDTLSQYDQTMKRLA